MKDKIQKLREQFQDELGTVNASSSLEELRRNFLSKKGYVSGLMKELGKVPPEQKKTTGQLINTFKQEVIAKFEEKEKELITKALEKNHGKRKLAAKDLGISERTLYRKLKEYNLAN